MSKAPVIRARNLLVGYGGEPVCAPVTFTLGPGRVLALVGANGSGKSTVLRAVLGLLKPAGGAVEVFGRPVDEREAGFRAKVASVLDDDAYFPALTVEEHLYLTARGHGVRGADEVVADALEAFGLTEHGASLPVALSSGQRRRLLLAAGFVRPRALLVLDEPEQRLDLTMRSRLAERLVAEKSTGGSVLLATHDPVLLRAVADRAVLIADDECELLSADDAAAAIAPGVL
ncbi:ABC transporter ATP-binding protein [Cellulomonas chengniuliangii]|uniref:ABC transporter ATP-binding protein n=1 Tax=Cellulomonas chengniuliangii TaxID=2968084 RepID=A0ABY5L0Z8_9CELL|nr:ABC transporter ATP-binding protein [Cellulomonas chengniuliangii]MCC2309912.1 ABC transporter ATP-binding protein [Cellulomonas chengniuliangii]UUI76354.1 ABC transporter ATP-binding protein [Cellulomonas chengniuliangii]